MGSRKASGSSQRGRPHRLSSSTTTAPLPDGGLVTPAGFDAFLPGLAPPFLMQGPGMLSGMPLMSASGRGVSSSHQGLMQPDLEMVLMNIGLIPWRAPQQPHPDSKRLANFNKWLEDSYELQQQGHLLWVAEQKELQRGSELAIISPSSTVGLSPTALHRSSRPSSPPLLGSPNTHALLMDPHHHHLNISSLMASPPSVLSPMPGAHSNGLGLGLLASLQPVTCVPGQSARRRLDLNHHALSALSPPGTATARALNSALAVHTGLTPGTATARALGMHGDHFGLGDMDFLGMDGGMHGAMHGMDLSFSYNSQQQQQQQDLGLGAAYNGMCGRSGGLAPLQPRSQNANMGARQHGMGMSDTPKLLIQMLSETPKVGSLSALGCLGTPMSPADLLLQPQMHGMDMESGLLNYDHGSHDAEAQLQLRVRQPESKRARFQ